MAPTKKPKRPRDQRRAAVVARLHPDPDRRAQQWRKGEISPKVRVTPS